MIETKYLDQLIDFLSQATDVARLWVVGSGLQFTALLDTLSGFPSYFTR
jgi:hypothetical protein